MLLMSIKMKVNLAHMQSIQKHDHILQLSCKLTHYGLVTTYGTFCNIDLGEHWTQKCMFDR